MKRWLEGWSISMSPVVFRSKDSTIITGELARQRGFQRRAISSVTIDSPVTGHRRSTVINIPEWCAATGNILRLFAAHPRVVGTTLRRWHQSEKADQIWAKKRRQ